MSLARSWRAIVATFKTPGRITIIAIYGLYLLFALIAWSWLAGLLSQANTAANILGAVDLILWIAVTIAVVWWTVDVFVRKPHRKE